MKKEEIKQLTGIGVFILYFVYSEYSIIPFKLLGIDYNLLPTNSKVMYLLITEFLLISILFFIYRNRFKKDFKDFKTHFKEYTKKYIDYWALSFGLMIACNLAIVYFFPNSVANNQEIINNIFKVAPLYTIISAVFFAPILEETIFRLSFRNIFKNDWTFILISGLVFGSLHVVGTFKTAVDLLYIIPYSIPGIVFAYTLKKSNNIFVPMYLHFFHNTFMMIIQLIVFLFL